MLSIVSFLASYHTHYNLHQIMAPKDPFTTPAFPGAEAHSAPVKNVSNSPIVPIASKEPAKDASKDSVKDAFKEPEKEASKGGIDAKKSKTESKKKVSNAAKLDAVDVATEVKVVEVVTVEAKVESSGVKELPNESSAKKEMPSSTKPSTGKEVLDEPSIKKEMAMPSSAKPSAAKEMPNEPSTKKEMPMSSSAKPSAGKEMSNEPSTKKDMPSSAKPSAAKEMPMMPSAVKVEVPKHSAATEIPSAAKVEVKVPATPPVVSSLKKPAEVSAPSVQPHVEEDEVVILKETVSKKFGEMTFSDYNSVEDGDYSLSEAETEDSLEWASETERTKVEDDLTEEKVGIDYIGAALDIATEQAASFRIVQAGLVIGEWVLSTVESIESIASSKVAPYLSSARRSARKIRRAGERESGPFRPLAMVTQSTMTMATTFLATPLA